MKRIKKSKLIISIILLSLLIIEIITIGLSRASKTIDITLTAIDSSSALGNKEMTNLFTLVGRIVEIKDNGVLINVSRNFKNVDGIYENDIFFVEYWNWIMGKVKEYCLKGDLVGVKGRMQQDEEKVRLICEKFTFLSNKKELLEKEDK